MMPEKRSLLLFILLKATLGLALAGYCQLAIAAHDAHVLSVYEEFKSKRLIREDVENGLRTTEGYSVEMRLRQAGAVNERLNTIAIAILVATALAIGQDILRLRRNPAPPR
jgi:hypothetical protein